MPLLEKQNILRFWRAVEFLCPLKIPEKKDSKREQPIFDLVPESPFPWEPSHELQRRAIPKDKEWRHLLYIGLYERAAIQDQLERLFGKDPASAERRATGQSCIFFLAVNNQGRPILDTALLASAPWAIGRITKAHSLDGVLSGFDEATEDFAVEFSERFQLRAGVPDDEKLRDVIPLVGRSVSRSELFVELENLVASLHCQSLGMKPVIRCKSLCIGKERFEHTSNSDDFLNSFYLNDLEKVRESVAREGPGVALDAYLHPSEIPDSEKIDVRENVKAVRPWLSPSRYPAGRWLSASEHSLYYSQQFDLNRVFSDKDSKGSLFAINGPPGTGKTTMLRDLIAGIVTERARRLTDLGSPSAAFIGKSGWKTQKWNQTIHCLHPALTGFEIVIASSNNGAVENVSLEIPAVTAISPQWLEVIDYFRDSASSILGKPAWGLVAAKLGKKSNRSEFVKKFWFSRQEPEAAENADNLDGMREWLIRAEHAPETSLSWPNACEDFRSTWKRFEELRSDLCEADSAGRKVDEATEWVEVARSKKRTLEDEISTYQLRIAELQEQLPKHEREMRRAEADLDTLRKDRPQWYEALFTLGKATRTWLVRKGPVDQKLDQTRHLINSVSNEIEQIATRVKEAVRGVRQLDNDIDGQQKSIQTLEKQTEFWRAKLRKNFPAGPYWDANLDTPREKSYPWSFAEWNQLRSELFAKALHVHKAFFSANAAKLRENLSGAIDILQGKVAHDAPTEAVQAAWASLFLVVPVVSTTFASFDRLFGHLKKEALGWLLIDEAGQATPQAAVGAIWRSRRVVVVGDPLQLEPIVTVPFPVQEALRKYYKVDPFWLPSRCSTQFAADRTSKFGTYVLTTQKPLWVGSPLRVHRRCDDPMFTVSNKVAYQGLMIRGKDETAPWAVEESSWIHVPSRQSDGNWIEEEWLPVVKLLQRLKECGVESSQIYLVAPFRDVVHGLKERIRKLNSTLLDRIGTIHTVQGKEAEIVIFVLGGNPERTGGLDWASETPNLLNVAVTRACRRLYVVGDRRRWKEKRYFEILAEELPTKSF
jgi:hypothetical protein